MSYQIVTDFAGEVGVNPRLVRMISTDTLSTITTAGYVNPAHPGVAQLLTTDFVFCAYSGGQGIFSVSITYTSGTPIITLSQADADVILPTVTDDITTFANTQGTIKDSGVPISSVIVASKTGGQTIASSTSSATPGTVRALTGAMTESATTMTSGNVVGVRGSVNMVGASGGFIYGAQGKVIPTGTLSGSSWTAGVFAQFDISAATINAGQTAPVWADYGATSGTITSATGMRMFAGTNTTAATLNAMDYRYGKASNLFELAGDAGSYITTGGATASGTIKKIAITIDGVQYYLQAATVYS